ncbi:MAG: replicative DNA helicase [Spirochaetota bacterium]|nr:replicative DNA helicase [Spirochaetota bacterium]
MDVGNLPPQDLDAETSCLASILMNKDALLKVTGILSAGDFYLDRHRIIYEAIIELERRNLPVDLITLKQQLSDLNRFDKIGGDPAIVELYRSASTSVNAEYYAKRVKELSLRRRLIAVSTDVVEKCYDMARDTDELIDEVEHDVFRVTERRITSDLKSIDDILNETMVDIRKMYETKKPITGIPTGFADLDVILSGLHKSDLIIVASRPSMGKTSLALNMANHIALKEMGAVLFFSLEMPATQLGLRLLCIEAMIDSQRVRTGHISSDEFNKLFSVSGKLEKTPIYIDDTPAVSIFELRAKARRMAQRESLGLIVVDYLQLITSSIKTERHLQIAEISRALKQLARELSVPVLALSQLSRAVEARIDQRPQLSDLRESGSIEQDADVVIFIYREERVKKETDKKGRAELMISKHRNGPIGNVELKFWEKYTKFDDLDTIHSYEEAIPIESSTRPV